MMKIYSFAVLMLLPFFVLGKERNTEAEVKKHRAESDSLQNREVKPGNAASIVKLHYTCGSMRFQGGNSLLIFAPRIGMGVDGTFALKLHQKLAGGIGVNFTRYGFDEQVLSNSVKNQFSDYDYALIDTAEKASFKRSSVYVYASYWLYKPKFVLEIYTKLGLAYHSLNINHITYRHKVFSQSSEFFLLNKPVHFTTFLPSLGVNGSVALNRILYLSLGGEYGFYISAPNQIQAEHFRSDATVNRVDIAMPRAQSIYQAHIGLMFRVGNRAKAN